MHIWSHVCSSWGTQLQLQTSLPMYMSPNTLHNFLPMSKSSFPTPSDGSITCNICQECWSKFNQEASLSHSPMKMHKRRPRDNSRKLRRVVIWLTPSSWPPNKPRLLLRKKARVVRLNKFKHLLIPLLQLLRRSNSQKLSPLNRSNNKTLLRNLQLLPRKLMNQLSQISQWWTWE